MRKVPLLTWVAVIAAVSWCAFAAFWLSPYREPLVGFGPRGYVQAMCFQFALALAFILLAHYRKHVLAGFLGIVLLLFALPLPSKAGALFRIENNTSTSAEIGIARSDDPQRRVLLSVPAGQRISYRTAPGEYPEGLQFVLESGTRSLTTSVTELRRREVHLSETNLWLAEVQKK